MKVNPDKLVSFNNIQSCNSEKMSNRWATSVRTVFNLKSLIIVINETKEADRKETAILVKFQYPADHVVHYSSQLVSLLNVSFKN